MALSKNKRNNKTVDLTKELSKTRQILWRFSKVEKNVEKKRTTFSELFFDLAVVFIFSLLASRLMGSIGHSVIQEEVRATIKVANLNGVIETTHSVGLLFWIAHFLALWFTWYQFSNYSKHHWIDNVGNNLFVLSLIFTLILQGAGIYFDSEELANYSLIFSFLSARILFVLAQYAAIKYSPRTRLSKNLMIKTKRQMAIAAITSAIVIIFVVCVEQGLLIPDYKIGVDVITYDPWKMELTISLILLTHLMIRAIWKFLGTKSLSKESYKIVFHTKERHHLFIIIALGELIVVTLTSSFINEHIPKINYETIIYMFSTPFIAMIIWYIYKTIFYKASPIDTKKNYYLYLVSHVVLVLGILVFLGSMKSHMLADNYINSNTSSVIHDSILQISRTFYSLGIVIGICMVATSMTTYAIFIQLEQKRWGKVVKSLSFILLLQSILIFIWFIIELIFFELNIPVKFSIVMYVTIAVEVLFAGLLIRKSQKTIITLFDTLEHFDRYASKLDD